VFADYRAPLDRAIHALKYRGELSIASTLGALLIPHGLALCPELGEGALLTAVPLSPARLRERGFNQAIEIARPIGRALSRPVAAGALLRVRFAQAQARLGPGQRSLNTIQAFEACHRTVSGRAVIVVDDVMTTGATLTAIARALKDAGALSVTNLVVTRTPIDHVQRRTGPP
jgi:ComF family protein